MARIQTRHGQPAVYNASAPTLTDGDGSALAVDVNQNLKVVGPSGSSSTTIQGPAADNAAAVGNPVRTGAKYNSATQTYADGDVADTQADVNGNTKITLGTLIAGEDLTIDVIKTEQRFSFSNVTADTAVKSGAGFLHTVTIMPTDAAATAGTIVLYDNTAESGTIIGTITVTAAWVAPVTLIFDCSFSTGLYVGFTTTADINVTVSYR